MKSESTSSMLSPGGTASCEHLVAPQDLCTLSGQGCPIGKCHSILQAPHSLQVGEPSGCLKQHFAVPAVKISKRRGPLLYAGVALGGVPEVRETRWSSCPLPVYMGKRNSGAHWLPYPWLVSSAPEEFSQLLIFSMQSLLLVVQSCSIGSQLSLRQRFL